MGYSALHVTLGTPNGDKNLHISPKAGKITSLNDSNPLSPILLFLFPSFLASHYILFLGSLSANPHSVLPPTSVFFQIHILSHLVMIPVCEAFILCVKRCTEPIVLRNSDRQGPL